MATTINSGAIYGVDVYGTSLYNVANVTYIPDGIGVTAYVDSVAIAAAANTEAYGLDASVNAGSVLTAAGANVPVNGVLGTSAVGSVVVFENEVVSAIGVAGTILLSSPSVLTASFDYEAVRENYEQLRTIYIEGRKARLLYIENQPRSVYVESPISQYERYAGVDGQYRQTYINRGTTQKERTVAVEE